MKFKKAVIIGPGLIGASIGLRMRKLKMSKIIVGVARHQHTLDVARKKGAITVAEIDPKTAVSGADLVIIATPVRSVIKILDLIKDQLCPGCLVFDVGSTKEEIVGSARKILSKNIDFIGTHPMAGSEKTGPEFAQEGLFLGSTTFVVKEPQSRPGAIKKTCEFWKKMGSSPKIMPAEAHDQIVAQISHLPHVLSGVLMNSVSDKALEFAANGFKDTTRIAASSAEIWTDIIFTNRKSVLAAVSAFEDHLNAFKKSLIQGQEEKISGSLVRAKKKRDALSKIWIKK